MVFIQTKLGIWKSLSLLFKAFTNNYLQSIQFLTFLRNCLVGIDLSETPTLWSICDRFTKPQWAQWATTTMPKPHVVWITIFNLGWEVPQHAVYFPDLTPTDYRLFRSMYLALFSQTTLSKYYRNTKVFCVISSRRNLKVDRKSYQVFRTSICNALKVM